MLDTEQRTDEAVALGLFDDPVAGIDENDGEVTVGCTGRHVTGVLFVSGAVGNDELALVSRKIAISYIDGDALLALGLETVGQ